MRLCSCVRVRACTCVCVLVVGRVCGACKHARRRMKLKISDVGTGAGWGRGRVFTGQLFCADAHSKFARCYVDTDYTNCIMSLRSTT